MKIGPLGITEIIIILAFVFLVLFVFGPKNLPKLGSAIGKAVKNLREGLGGKKNIDEKDENGSTKQTAENKQEEVSEEAEVIEVIDKPEPGHKPKDKDSKDE